VARPPGLTRVRAAWALAALLTAHLALSGAAGGQSEPTYPKPVGLLNDFAGVISGADRDSLDLLLARLQRQSRIQFAVVTMKSTAPLEPAEYKTQLFRQWGIGQKGQDTGLLMLVAIDERQVWFETGYGLEGVLPDGLQARIARQRMVPAFRQGDYGGGILAGVNSVIAVLHGAGLTELEGSEAMETPRRRGPPRDLFIAIVTMIAIFALVNALRGPRGPMGRRRYRS